MAASEKRDQSEVGGEQEEKDYELEDEVPDVIPTDNDYIFVDNETDEEAFELSDDSDNMEVKRLSSADHAIKDNAETEVRPFFLS
jgi:hypothetical protein